MPITLTPEIARAAAWDAGNRSMRAAGRAAWNGADWDVACAELERLEASLPAPRGRAER